MGDAVEFVLVLVCLIVGVVLMASAITQNRPMSIT
jgi:hypothetical protein